MNTPIYNRENQAPADGWFQIEVSGTHPVGDGRRQVIDDYALRAIVNRFQAEASAENFAGLLVDADHLSHDLENPTAALAWLKELDIRNGELHGRLELTDLGEAAVKGKRYKWFSTEYSAADLEALPDNAVRPHRLSGLAFTNRPNNRGAKPISNRDGKDAAGGEQTDTETNMQPIALKLGLPADADEAAVLKKLTDLMSELESLKGKAASSEADAIMNRYGARIPEGARDSWKQQLITNREATEKLMETSFPERAGEQKGQGQAAIFNRQGAKAPEAVESRENAANAASHAKAAAIRNRAQEIHNRERIPFNAAFARAQGELGA